MTTGQFQAVLITHKEVLHPLSSHSHSSLYYMYFYFFIFFIFNLFYLFLAALGLRCWARAFSSCGEQGLLLVTVHRLLTVVASLVAEHGL